MSKIEQARKIYAANAGKPRLEIISMLQTQLGLARGTASGYHDSCKKAALKAAQVAAHNLATQASAYNVVVDAKINAVLMNDKFEPVQSASKPKAVVSEEAKITDLKPKFRNVASSANKPLHSFSTEEMLEILDPQTRAEVEAIFAQPDARG